MISSKEPTNQAPKRLKKPRIFTFEIATKTFSTTTVDNIMEAPAPRVPGGTWDVPTFTGDGKGPSLNTWLNAIALAHEMNGLTTGQTLKLVKARVDGLATAILEGIPSTANFPTIDELINGIRGLFTDGSDALSKLRDLWQQGQKQDELLELFAL